MENKKKNKNISCKINKLSDIIKCDTKVKKCNTKVKKCNTFGKKCTTFKK